MTMKVKKIFTEDIEIANAILKRNEKVTRDYLYKKCYPLFKSIFDNYYTDCNCCKEFIDDIYILIMTPSKKTGRCQLENFRGESTLLTWLKSVCIFYSFNKYKKNKLYINTESIDNPTKNHADIDRKGSGSVSIDLSNINSEDVQIILDLMPNKTYSELLRLRYLDNMTNKEVAKVLGVTMDNYYNMHLRAQKQYELYHGKEEHHA